MKFQIYSQSGNREHKKTGLFDKPHNEATWDVEDCAWVISVHDLDHLLSLSEFSMRIAHDPKLPVLTICDEEEPPA